MNKKLISVIILVSVTVSFLIPFLGKEKKSENIVTETEESTNDETVLGLYSGVIERNVMTLQNVYSKESQKQDWYCGYTTDRVNIRTEPSLTSEVLDITDFNEEIYFKQYNEDWLEIAYITYDNTPNDINAYITQAYISSKYITDTPCPSVDFNIPENNGFKSYMSYKSITDKSSRQYDLQSNYAYTGDYGIRMINNRYCIAIGTAFNAEIGDYVDLVLKNGETIQAIVADIKANEHTDHNNIATISNGCVSEFIVDAEVLASNIAKQGDVSVAKEEWNSEVVTIRIYDKNVFD